MKPTPLLDVLERAIAVFFVAWKSAWAEWETGAERRLAEKLEVEAAARKKAREAEATAQAAKAASIAKELKARAANLSNHPHTRWRYIHNERPEVGQLCLVWPYGENVVICCRAAVKNGIVYWQDVRSGRFLDRPLVQEDFWLGETWLIPEIETTSVQLNNRIKKQ